KVAAIEAHWQRGGDVPLLLFAVPDMERARNDFEIAVPYLGSLILTHSLHGEVPGLTDVPPEDRPPVIVVFWSFRIMVGLALIMLAVAWLGVLLLARTRGSPPRWFLRIACACGPVGFLAVLAGWITTEVGRQPWLVYGLLRTADGASQVPAGNVEFSLALFIGVYALLFYAFGVFFARAVRRGPGQPPPGNIAQVAEAHS
ncbi:MAG TPA: cytochrome ubiquinol oxidase subunit I, partial [Nevskiaceae bacterium]|nr:cytochrome ubiquinol oxidase subunit I [Nevskiaceae bacterium]